VFLTGYGEVTRLLADVTDMKLGMWHIIIII